MISRRRYINGHHFQKVSCSLSVFIGYQFTKAGKNGKNLLRPRFIIETILLMDDTLATKKNGKFHKLTK